MNNLVYGLHAVKAALLNKHNDCSQAILYLEKNKQSARMSEIQSIAKKSAVQINYSLKAELEKKFPYKHQGVVLVYQQASDTSTTIKNETYLEQILESQFSSTDSAQNSSICLLILDGVQDPHNLGACLRTANAVGVAAIIIPKDRSVGLTPIVRKVACGADQFTPIIQVTNLARTLDYLKQYQIWITGLAGESEKSVFDSDLSGHIGIVMGAEGKGLRRLTREKCDQIVKLPMLGDVESLNVSVATGVVLYEVLRQRLLSC